MFSRPARWGILIGLLASCLSLVGCKEDGISNPVPCTAISVPGIMIEVRDAETGLPAACGASAFIASGDYLETVWIGPLQCIQPDSLQNPWIEGAYERPGTYSVLVIKEGYANWSASGIRVFDEGCHVSTVRLTAALEPVP